MAEDSEIHRRIGDLVAEERELRGRLGRHEISADEEHEHLRDIGAQLDQCWDLLRQRAAAREYGEDPSGARVRSESVVEGYEG
ncbi:MAG TPA: DUF2630 family protein [Nocardioidaceae bacterium]|nr:DUF2630 family protein [Nocardioidaceae bacterium]